MSEPAIETRRLPKRERTRLTLLRSAMHVIAAKGIAATRITDITEHVGMANGTFYNYFTDKTEIVQAVAAHVAAELGAALNARMADETDPIARVEWATSQAITQAVKDAEFGLVLVESMEQLPDVREGALHFLRKDLEYGVDQRVFDVEVTEFLLDQVVALIVSSIRSQIRFGEDERKTKLACVNVLRVCGVKR